MGIESLGVLTGEWELVVDLRGAEGVRGHVLFETMGDVLLQRTTLPIPDAPDSCCVVVPASDGGYVQHYFDSRGVARLYAMTFDGRTWTLERSTPDFSPLDIQQRFVGSISETGTTIDGQWQSSADGRTWTRDFGLTYRKHAPSEMTR
jgi:hypothetical protein